MKKQNIYWQGSRLSHIFFLFLLLTQSAFFLADDKHFVIDICSYNNKSWYKQNLGSVFKQDYKNYRIIYTDDCSTDGTGFLVTEYVKKLSQEGRVTLKRNAVRQRMLANHWRVIHQCKDNEIIIHLDGDDFFAHEHVLSRLNEIYQDDNVWMTYGSYAFWPKNEVYKLEEIPSRVLRSGSYRKSNFKKSPYHPRTFYAWLAKRIKLEDLLYTAAPFSGQFTPAISDWSLLYPMFEMAAGRYRLISEVLYRFNVINPLNHDKDKKTLRLQRQCASFVCRKKPYTSLPARPKIAEKTEELIDIIISGQEGQQPLSECFKGYDRIFHLDADIDLDAITEYICVITDAFKSQSGVDLLLCKQMLEKTHAKVFFLGFEQVPQCSVWLEGNVYAFYGQLARVNRYSGFICKKDVLMEIQNGGGIQASFSNFKGIGLFFNVDKTNKGKAT